MSGETISLKPGTYDNLGVVHCGVTRDLTATCAGDLHKLEDGEEYTFSRAHVKVKRNGDEFVFTKQ